MSIINRHPVLAIRGATIKKIGAAAVAKLLPVLLPPALIKNRPSFSYHWMNDGKYKGGGTTGGKWGCAFAAVFGLPVFCLSVLVASMGDCMPGVQCHPGFWFEVLLPTVLVEAPIGFGVRWAANRRRGNDR